MSDWLSRTNASKCVSCFVLFFIEKTGRRLTHVLSCFAIAANEKGCHAYTHACNPHARVLSTSSAYYPRRPAAHAKSSLHSLPLLTFALCILIMGWQNYSHGCLGWWWWLWGEEEGQCSVLGFPPMFQQQTVLKYLRPDSIHLAERRCPPSLPPCQPASFIRHSRCCVQKVCADPLYSFHGYVWNRPALLLYIFTILLFDSSALWALPLRFCVLTHVALGFDPCDVTKGNGISPNSSKDTP